jgi:CHAT domain-containing protein
MAPPLIATPQKIQTRYTPFRKFPETPTDRTGGLSRLAARLPIQRSIVTRPTLLVIILVLAAGLLFGGVGGPLRRAGWTGKDLALVQRMFEDDRLAAGRFINRLELPGRANSAPARPPISRGPSPLERTLSDPAPPGALRTEAVLRLAKGRFDSAILLLEAAVNQEPRNAESQSDLSAALLTRARAQNRATDLLRALEAADQALSVTPDRPEALYNRAEALAQVHLRNQARRAWETYLQADSTSAWADIARGRLRDLSRPTLAEGWERDRPELERSARQGDSRQVRDIVSRYPQAARLWIEEQVLPAWGGSFAAGDLAADPNCAGGWLNIARQIGTALFDITGDAMLHDTVAAIDQAQEHGSAERLSQLASGHAEFGRAMALYRSPEQRLNDAHPLLAHSSGLLAAADTPFAGWADFYLGVCLHYGGADRSGRLFRQLRERFPPEQYPVLVGSSEWMIGTLEHNVGQPESALLHFRMAYARLDGTSPQESGFVHVLIAEAYDTLGEIEAAWRERLTALEWVSRSGDRRRTHSTLHEAATALLAEENPAATPAFLEELLESDANWGNVGALTETYFLRGRAWDLLGRGPASLQEFRAAEEQSERIAASAQKDRIKSLLRRAEGEALTNRQPKDAVSVLTAALESDLKQNFFYQLTPILTARAKAYEVLGDEDNAENDLQLAIKEHEHVRSGVQDEQLRLTYFEKAQLAFDEMIRLQIDRLGAADRAFDFAERARARVLLDLTSGHGSTSLPQAMDGKAVRAHLPPGITLIEYALLPERLEAWVVDRGAITPIMIPIREGDIEQKVQVFRSTVVRRAPRKEIEAAAASLYDLLIRPLEPNLPAEGRLIFVPDRVLVQVPFAALYDSARGRYLIEDWSIAVSPSATLFIMATEKLRRFDPHGPWTALVVGDPAFNRKRNFTLSRLPQAAAEAVGVARLYDRPDLLQDESATRDRFLADAGNYRLIHFAGHALLHPTSPRLSRLLLAPTASSPSGALYAHEITALPLENTEIVVLSACRTVADNEGNREGLTGLAAAFLAAGSPVVIASLWNLDDRFTRPLILAFYHDLHRGEDPGTALRQAQVRLLHDSDAALRSPANWAGLEAIGGAFFIQSN